MQVIRTIAVIIMGILRASALGLGGFLLGYNIGYYPPAIVLGVVGIILGILIEIAEEAARNNSHLSLPMLLLRIIGGGGLRVLAGVAIGAFIGSAVSHSSLVVILAAVTGGVIAVLIEIADRFNWGGVFLRIMKTIYEGAIGALGGFGIGLLIALIAYIPQWISVPPGSSNDVIEAILKAIAATAVSGIISIIVALIVIIIIASFIAIVGAVVGLIAGAIVEFTWQPQKSAIAPVE